jgi:UDP-N-acetylglucosamine--N-acetylmuramyl-(pentapeptide) pyrophosphoryl-undecaprenol N-acetylglucosamine transferase
MLSHIPSPARLRGKPRLPRQRKPSSADGPCSNMGDSGTATALDRTLLVASTGGHLEELIRLRSWLQLDSDACEWVTFDDSQSRSLLADDKRVHFVRPVTQRDYYGAALNLVAAQRLLSSRRFARVVSTGAGIAVPFLSVARAYGVSCHYVESAARSQGASLTGRVASLIPGVRLYSQYEEWSTGPWHYRGSLFDGYRVEARTSSAARTVERVVVTLGTQGNYPFRRAVEAVTRVLPQVAGADTEVLWQVASTDTSDLGIRARDRVQASELHQAIAEADVVICHAGVGSVLNALDRGKSPVLLPRSRAYGEHVDDHQWLIAEQLALRGLAIPCNPDDLTAEHLRRSMDTVVARVDHAAPFQLVS